MLALANVVNFLPDELAGLRRGRLALGRVLAGALSRLLLRHSILLSVRRAALDVWKSDGRATDRAGEGAFRNRLQIWRARGCERSGGLERMRGKLRETHRRAAS